MKRFACTLPGSCRSIDPRRYLFRYVLLSALLWVNMLAPETVWCADQPKVPSASSAAQAKPGRLLVVVGAPGESQYQSEFQRWAEGWRKVAPAQHLELTVIGADQNAGESGDREQLKQAIQAAINDQASSLWIVLIGHGTSDRGVTKFNMRGSDVTVNELNTWLKPWHSRLVFICCTSSSGPFMTELSGPERIIVTATRSGTEQNYARFGQFLASAITDTAADLDHDDEVSLLEAFLAASAQTEKFYKEASRLATEHALLDDNGDKLGTGSSFFKGLRPAVAPESGKSLDGALASRIMLRASQTGPTFSAEQLSQREQIEKAIESLRNRKNSLSADEYYSQLEVLVLQLASVYSQAEVPSSPTSAKTSGL